MPGFMPGIHAFLSCDAVKQGVDGRAFARQRVMAVYFSKRAMARRRDEPGHDELVACACDPTYRM
jgi:hypothetical protein